MKIKKTFILLTTVSLLSFILHSFFSSGFFRKIENSHNRKILKKIELYGTEDITISYKDSFAIISSTDRKQISKDKIKKNGLYFIDLKDTSYTPVFLTKSLSKEFNPHGISLLKKDSSYYIYAINHTANNKHSIEIFSLKNKKAIHLKTLKDETLISPNDLVVLDHNNIYITNDHYFGSKLGKLIEDCLGMAISNIIHFNGTNYNQVASGISYANGINIDISRNLLFVASPRKFLIKVYRGQ